MLFNSKKEEIAYISTARHIITVHSKKIWKKYYPMYFQPVFWNILENDLSIFIFSVFFLTLAIKHI